MADKVGTDPEFSKIADTVLKIAALVGVAAAIASFGYNFAQCAPNNFVVAISIPTFLLALFVFSIALGLTDKTFGNFRDMDFSAGIFIVKASSLVLYLLGYLMEVSLFVVAFYAFRVAGNLPNCLP
ncbi:hypothetical protein [Nitratireductor sp. XY-223]|uniref:hypothetical protein n=1 Tax=Nitratireductor sp. XY-223 TaxID=2561926 RepID=UPI0010AAC07F|nr:hypothetical protein [Nitratireductor sp. XY-223]